MDIDITLVKNYFEQVARRMEEHCVIPIRTEVFAHQSRTRPFEVEVVIRVYNCESTDDTAFQEHVQCVFEVARNELLYRKCSCFTSIKMSVMLYDTDPQIGLFNYGVGSSYLPVSPLLPSKSKEEEAMYDVHSVPEVKEIIHSTSKKKGELFTVKWADNTETTVKRMEGDTSDDYVAFMYCVSIKMFGGKGECRKYIKDKKNVFNERVAKRSEEIRNRKLQKVEEDRARRNVPYAEGLRVPALAQSSVFKKNGGN